MVKYGFYSEDKSYEVSNIAGFLDYMRKNEEARRAFIQKMKHFKTFWDGLVEFEEAGLVNLERVGAPNVLTDDEMALNLCEVFQREFPKEWKETLSQLEI